MNAGDINQILVNIELEFSRGNYKVAEDLIDSIKQQTSTDDEFHLSAILYLAKIALMQGRMDEAIALATHVAEKSKELKYVNLHPSALIVIGRIFAAKGDYDLSIMNYVEAQEEMEKLKDKKGVNTVIGNIGIAHYFMGNIDQALKYWEQALKLAEDLDDKIAVSRHTSNIGNIYVSLKEYDKALEYYFKAIQRYEALGAIAGLADTFGNIAVVYIDKEEFEKAQDYNDQSLKLYEQLDNKHGIVTSIGRSGTINSRLKHYDKAMSEFMKSYELSQNVGDKMLIAFYCKSIAEIYLIKESNLHSDDKAKEYLDAAINQCEGMNAKHLESNVYGLYSKLYENENNWKEAHDYFLKFYKVESEMKLEEATNKSLLFDKQRKLEEAERDRQVKIARFQEQEKILYNILPIQIADRILDGEKKIADYYSDVSIFFSDIVGFTKLSQKISPQELVDLLNNLFTRFDHAAKKHGLEKIKTIGDAYMAVAGAPIPCDDHAERAALFALEIKSIMEAYRLESGSDLEVRIGLHSGSAVAGVIGENKFAYDLWGDAVNTASRMESHGEQNKIHVSEAFAIKLKDKPFHFEERGMVEVKGKGSMKTYFLT